MLDGTSDSILVDVSIFTGLKLKELLYTGRTALNRAEYADFGVLKRLLQLNITSVTVSSASSLVEELEEADLVVEEEVEVEVEVEEAAVMVEEEKEQSAVELSSSVNLSRVSSNQVTVWLKKHQKIVIHS